MDKNKDLKEFVGEEIDTLYLSFKGGKKLIIYKIPQRIGRIREITYYPLKSCREESLEIEYYFKHKPLEYSFKSFIFKDLSLHLLRKDSLVFDFVTDMFKFIYILEWYLDQNKIIFKKESVNCE